ncbi:hypothetical protein [Thiosocius teredinicola]|uniref:hypothetical protein n=1 Tax=Thiosocius teredinicola TaxID=1973002 RepID=UPI0009913B3B
MQSTPWPQRLESTLLRAAIWALVGVIFGFIFVVLVEFLRDHLPFMAAILVGAVGASALTALFYGSMRLTVMVANLTFVAMLLVTWQSGGQVSLNMLVLAGALVGLPVGALYGRTDKLSRVFCADAKIIAGAFAGAVGGLLVFVIGLVSPDWAASRAAWVIAPTSALVYVTAAHWFVRRCRGVLPPTGDGALVGVGVGAMTGLLFMIMAGSLDPSLLDSDTMRAFATRVEHAWGVTVIACGLVCAVVGVARALLDVPWYDL